MPEQPPPFTPTRTPLCGFVCARRASWALICCAARGVTVICGSAIDPLLLGRCLRLGGEALLLLPVRDRRLDGVLRQHRAVDLHRRQRELLRDLGVLDRHRLVHRLSLHPLGNERGGSDGRSAPESLELRVLDLAVIADLHLQPHHVAAGGRADEPGPDVRVVLVQRPYVSRVLVVIQDLVAVRHFGLLALARYKSTAIAANPPSAGAANGPPTRSSRGRSLRWPSRRAGSSRAAVSLARPRTCPRNRLPHPC